MPEINKGRPYKLLGIIVFGALILSAILMGAKFMAGTDVEPEPPAPEAKTHGAVSLPPVLDYDRIEMNEDLQSLMKKRKEAYGIDKGIDLVIHSDESVKIGDLTVTLQEIEEKIRLKTGDILEKDLAEQPSVKAVTPRKATGNADHAMGSKGTGSSPADDKEHPPPRRNTGQGSQEKVRVYGIHIVRPGDNIWNIHFNFIKSYFVQRNILVESQADESDNKGFSSGIGRILKFSESMVYIYNLREKRLDVDLNLIHPMTKIVVFNLQQVFALLDQVDYTFVNRIEFDGKTIWIPSAQ